TGGTHPRRLREVLPWTDWVGLDVKAGFQDYDAITRIHGSGAAAQASLDILLEHGADFECRSTIHPRLHSPDALLSLGRRLHDLGVRRYALQVFRAQGCQDAALNDSGKALGAYPGDAVIRTLAGLFPSFEVRRA